MELTITFKEIEFEVGFDYQPEEKQYFNFKEGYGHPGCSASIEGIWKVEHKGTDFIPFLDEFFGEDEWCEAMKEKLWSAMANAH
jgi:hypothetical protein